jgi:hyperosmotically inducible protein
MQTPGRVLRLVMVLVVIVALIDCAGNRTSASTGEYVDDNVITAKVKAALFADKEVSGFQVGVETFKGIVQLSGFVDTAAQAKKAEQVARGISGVKSVKNSLVVK